MNILELLELFLVDLFVFAAPVQGRSRDWRFVERLSWQRPSPDGSIGQYYIRDGRNPL